MNKINNELLYSFRSSKFLVILITVTFSICCFIGFFSFSLYAHVGGEKVDFAEKYIDTQYYQLGDNFVDDFESTFQSSQNYVGKLKKFYNKLKTNENFKYFEVHRNPIYFINDLPNKSFLYSYESGFADNDIIAINKGGIQQTLYTVKALFASNNIYNGFDLDLLDGNWFSENDYKLENAQNNAIVNVVLGFEYSKYYKVGDIIQGNGFPLGDMSYHIIGFLNQNSYVYTGNHTTENLDRYVIIPAFNYDSYEFDSEAASIYTSLYYVKTSGIVATKLNTEAIQAVISDICSELDIFPAYYVVGASNQPNLLLGMDMDIILNVLKMVSVFITIFICFIMIVFVIITIRRNLKYYSILLINGFTYKDIILLILLQPILICLIAYVVGAIINIILTALLGITLYSRGFLYLLLINSMIFITTSIFAVVELRKYDMSLYLRKR